MHRILCKMTVDESIAAATAEYKGKIFYVCASGCKDTFEKEPEKYDYAPAGGSVIRPCMFNR